MAGQGYIDLTRYYDIIEIFKFNKRLNKFYLFCKYWKGKTRRRLNDIVVISISFLYFLI